jgi:hypothetical protein
MHTHRQTRAVPHSNCHNMADSCGASHNSLYRTGLARHAARMCTMRHAIRSILSAERQNVLQEQQLMAAVFSSCRVVFPTQEQIQSNFLLHPVPGPSALRPRAPHKATASRHKFCTARDDAGPSLWSSSQCSWLQIRRPGFDSRHYQKKKVVGLEWGPLGLVSKTEELLDRKVAAPV